MLSENEVSEVLARTDKAVARLQERLSTERNVQLAAIRKLSIKCIGCKKRSPMHRWTFIQDRYYVRPSGCTEGDYWVSSRFEHCTMLCPACNRRNQISFRFEADFAFLIKLVSERHFELTKLFDPAIIIEAESQSAS